MEKIKIIDTNILLQFSTIILTNKCIIPSVVLSEIESIKTNLYKSDEVKFQARQASRFLDENSDKYDVFIVDNEIYDIVSKFKLPISNDNLIIACAYKLKINKYGDNIVFVSNDRCARLVAKNYFLLQAENYINLNDVEYKGYKEVCVSDEDLAAIYQNPNVNIHNCLINQYLIIKNKLGSVVEKLKWDGENYVSLKLNKFKDIKPQNIQQELAFDLMLSDTPIKILVGTAGSGKSLINVKFALNAIQKGKVSRILYLRDACGKGTGIGFLPGTKDEKLRSFTQSLTDNLDRGEYELEELIQRGIINIESPFFIKGASKENTWFLVDEAEDLDIEMIKLIGTRVSKGSYICFSGDLRQTEKKYKCNNGLEAFIHKFKGSSLVGIVKLQDDFRSETSKLFNSL